ncbi:anibiotic ABC transporter efflux pump [Spiractinospora alimapuensis]|uniref:ABC transporter permease n=1 Tax=Spiractinospora alimapuensis TaxID=2820884 RepID=UPI001F4507CC|nr:anibiotic ABC transporter efflux pump [Spiractinospora alimapuensis]QVQ50711.1 anibiotic ABC transporter efflux pump [Spiractinospora alimapuensis]
MSAATRTSPRSADAPVGARSPLAGTGSLVRLILRRDRVRIPVWIIALTATVTGTAPAFSDLYPTQTDIDLRIAVVTGNPVGVVFTSPGYGVENATPNDIGPLLVNELSATMIVLFALMSLFLLVRYTRAEEESGRGELVRSGVVGRAAPLAAAFIVVVAANLLTGALITLGLGGMDLAWEGSLAFGASLALLGVVVAGVAAVCAQVSEFGRTAAGLAGAVFGLTFLVRAIGDIQDSDLRWWSPVAWSQGMRPYAGEEWWPAFALVGLALILALIAFVLNARRDFGAALLRPRRGRAAASRFLRSPLALAVRLHRGSAIAWTAIVLAAAVPLGAVLVEEGEELADMEVFQEMFGSGTGAAEEVLRFYLGFISLIIAAFTIQAVLRARGEETAGRAEPLLAAAVARWRWAGSHLAVSVVGSVAILVVTGFGTGLAAAAQSDESSHIANATGEMLAYVPALAVLAGLTFALHGVLPRFVALAWVPYAYFFFVAMFAGLFDLPEEAMDVSPFVQVSNATDGDLSVAPLLWLSGIAAALMAVGFWGISRRDVASG